MHLKTRNKVFNKALKAELGSLYAKHTATLTREEAHEARRRIQSLSSNYSGVMTLDLKNSVKDLVTACNLKLGEGGKK